MKKPKKEKKNKPFQLTERELDLLEIANEERKEIRKYNFK